MVKSKTKKGEMLIAYMIQAHKFLQCFQNFSNKPSYCLHALLI